MATDTKPDPRLVGSTGVQQLLEWVDERPRSYPETIDAWKSSCPRLTIWEDALAARLIRIRAGRVLLTDEGRQRLAPSHPSTSRSGSCGYEAGVYGPPPTPPCSPVTIDDSAAHAARGIL